MIDIAGVYIRENEKGKVTHITFEVDKHNDLIQQLLERIGIVQEGKKWQDYEYPLSAE